MKRIITLFTFILSLNLAFAQNFGNPSECDSVDIISLGYNPFDMSELLVRVQNNNQLEIFSYPGFKLTNTNGDTVAEETVNFFGISQESVHQLNTTLTGYMPGDIFNGELLLYSGFYDSLRCVFPVAAPLIPNGGCSEFYISTTDWSENIMQSLYWTVTNEQGTVVASGEHNHTVQDFTLQDTVCLPNNNCYTLNVSSNNPLEGNSDIAINYIGFWISEGSQMLQGNTEYNLDFSVYFCDSVLSIDGVEAELKNIKVQPNPAIDNLKVMLEGDIDFHTIEVFDLAGRKVLSQALTAQAVINLNLEGLLNGVYTLRLIGDESLVSRKFVKSDQ